MSLHINAPDNSIASTVLMPGDPLRAKFIADTYLENPTCYNEVRGMLGFTGTYRGERISVQGSGMGMPSIAIYATELIKEYRVANLIRVGTCGAMQPNVQMRDIVLAQTASTDSSSNKDTFRGWDFAPCADFFLLQNAYETARRAGIAPHVGNILSTDVFYREDKSVTDRLIQHGVLAVEMESSALYTIAARHQARALSVLTVSDHLLTGESTSAEERQTSFRAMMEIALETAVQASQTLRR
jgi:purine-nucleoside phosphorylase